MHTYFVSQMQEAMGLGSSSVRGVDLGSSQTQGEDLRLGQDSWSGPSPSSNIWTYLNRVGLAEPTHPEAFGREFWA